MAKFNKKSKVTQGIPTAALPDIIFILLFFFMVVTTVKDKKQQVTTIQPEATQVQKIDEAKKQINVFIGVPKDPKFGSQPVVEINGKFVQADGVKYELQKIYEGLPVREKSVNNMIVYLKVDENVQMGIVIDVKQQLRKFGVRSINYSSRKLGEDS